jgi:hypothetical protein
MPGPSGKAGLASGTRRSQARRDGRICARSSANPLARIADTRCAALLDPDANSLRQNGYELVERALDTLGIHFLLPFEVDGRVPWWTWYHVSTATNPVDRTIRSFDSGCGSYRPSTAGSDTGACTFFLARRRPSELDRSRTSNRSSESIARRMALSHLQGGVADGSQTRRRQAGFGNTGTDGDPGRSEQALVPGLRL